MLENLDLSKLISGKLFIISSKLALNRYAVFIYSLINFKANSKIFINIQHAINCARFFSTYLYKLSQTCSTKGFNNKKNNLIIYIIFLHFWIDS
jgi:glyoxylate utilization-related uncharacterized protein